jgi:hypothetical protein
MPLRLIIAFFCCECENKVNDSNILTFFGLNPDLTIENEESFGVFLVVVAFICKEMLIQDICNWDQNKLPIFYGALQILPLFQIISRFDFIRFINCVMYFRYTLCLYA